MSEQTTTKRAYRRISAEHLAYAKRRFSQEFASTSAVRAELKARGGDYSHSQLHYHWHLANKGFGGKLATGPHDHDHLAGDAQDGGE